jgi:hypothetical protein
MEIAKHTGVYASRGQARRGPPANGFSTRSFLAGAAAGAIAGYVLNRDEGRRRPLTVARADGHFRSVAHRPRPQATKPPDDPTLTHEVERTVRVAPPRTGWDVHTR